MRTLNQKLTIPTLVLVAATSFGCASRPGRQPKILSSYAPPGNVQPLPVNSRQAIQVPMADVGARVPATPAVPAQPYAVPAVPQGQAMPAQPVVPVQPVPQQQQQFAPQQQQQMVPQQQIVPQQHLVPEQPGPSSGAPENSRQFDGSGTRRAEPQNDYDWSRPDGRDPNERRLIAPDPGDLNS